MVHILYPSFSIFKVIVRHSLEEAWKKPAWFLCAMPIDELAVHTTT